MTPIERPVAVGTGARVTAAASTAVTPKDSLRAVREAPDDALESGIVPPSAGDATPVDIDRVSVIRKAVEEGRYPVLPTRIADAMIAAGFLLRNKD